MPLMNLVAQHGKLDGALPYKHKAETNKPHAVNLVGNPWNSLVQNLS